MKKRLVFICAVIFFSVPNIFAQSNNSPKIEFKNGIYKLHISEKMKKSLREYNPEFKSWKTSDYTNKVIKETDSKAGNVAPFAIIIDVNRDKKLDVIIDGFNGKEREILCILSDKKSYKTINVDLWENQSNPQSMSNYNNGVIEYGFNYFLWPNKNISQSPQHIFTIGIPQQTDTQGKLLNDGGMVVYRYSKGRFYRHYPEF